MKGLREDGGKGTRASNCVRRGGGGRGGGEASPLTVGLSRHTPGGGGGAGCGRVGYMTLGRVTLRGGGGWAPSASRKVKQTGVEDGSPNSLSRKVRQRGWGRVGLLTVWQGHTPNTKFIPLHWGALPLVEIPDEVHLSRRWGPFAVHGCTVFPGEPHHLIPLFTPARHCQIQQKVRWVPHKPEATMRC